MKLSSELQEWVRKKKLQEIGELGKKRDAELKRIVETTPKGGGQISGIADQHIEFNQKSIEVTMQAYLEAYELEEKILDVEDIQGIMAEIQYPWPQQKQAISQFGPRLGSQLDRIEREFQSEVNKARTNLFQAKTVMDVKERKRANAMELKDKAEAAPAQSPSEVKAFVVHGRDSEVKLDVARFLEQHGLKAIILHEMPNQGKTVIEKFFDYSDVQFAVVLLTPDDKGGLADSPPESLQPRARQNVIFELGFFLGRLGRNKVCAIYKSGVEIPSDYQGILYLSYEGNWKYELLKELRAAGLNVKD